MDQPATGLVVRTRPLTESSLIVHWITRDSGRIATVAKGARRPKSPFRGKLDLFYLCDFTFVPSRRSDLHTLREVVVRNYHAPLRLNLDSLQQAGYAAALIETNTEPNTPLPTLFNLLLAFIQALLTHPPLSLTLLTFEIKFLVEFGLDPRAAQQNWRPATPALLRQLATADWNLIPTIKLAPSQLLDLNHDLAQFLGQTLTIPPARHLAFQM